MSRFEQKVCSLYDSQKLNLAWIPSKLKTGKVQNNGLINLDVVVTSTEHTYSYFFSVSVLLGVSTWAILIHPALSLQTFL